MNGLLFVHCLPILLIFVFIFLFCFIAARMLLCNIIYTNTLDNLKVLQSSNGSICRRNIKKQ